MGHIGQSADFETFIAEDYVTEGSPIYSLLNPATDRKMYCSNPANGIHGDASHISANILSLQMHRARHQHTS